MIRWRLDSFWEGASVRIGRDVRDHMAVGRAEQPLIDRGALQVLAGCKVVQRGEELRIPKN